MNKFAALIKKSNIRKFNVADNDDMPKRGLPGRTLTVALKGTACDFDVLMTSAASAFVCQHHPTEASVFTAGRDFLASRGKLHVKHHKTANIRHVMCPVELQLQQNWWRKRLVQSPQTVPAKYS